MWSTLFIAALFIIQEDQNLETTYMPLNQGINKENVVWSHMEYYSAVKTNKQTKPSDILNFAGKCTELEKKILSEVSQTQKDKYGM